MLVLGVGGLDLRFLEGEALTTNVCAPFLGGGPVRVAGDVRISMDLRGFFAADGLDAVGCLDVARLALVLRFLVFVTVLCGVSGVPVVNCDTVCHGI